MAEVRSMNEIVRLVTLSFIIHGKEFIAKFALQSAFV